MIQDEIFEVNGRKYECTQWSAVEGMRKGMRILKHLAPFLKGLPNIFEALEKSQKAPKGSTDAETEKGIQIDQIKACTETLIYAKDIDPELITELLFEVCEGVIRIKPNNNIRITPDYFNDRKGDFLGVAANAIRVQLVPFLQGSDGIFSGLLRSLP